jgi:hypothetical protein
MKRFCLSLAITFILSIISIASASAAALPAGVTALQLASISNDRDSSISDIKLMVNHAGNVRGIYLETRASADSDPVQAKAQVYLLAGLESRDGVVLGQGQGVKAIFLKGDIPPQGDHGSLVIRYLANGIFRHFKECRIGLERLGPGNWQLVNAYDGRLITHIEVQTWALGISTISNVCPARTA